MIDIKDENWDETISNSGDKLVIVDFWAPWCVPCRSIALSLQECEDKLGERVRIMKMNIDDNPNVSGSLGIRAIPTILFYKDGQLCDKQVGVISTSHLMDKIASLL
jgi:thioredoxin 1